MTIRRRFSAVMRDGFIRFLKGAMYRPKQLSARKSPNPMQALKSSKSSTTVKVLGLFTLVVVAFVDDSAVLAQSKGAPATIHREKRVVDDFSRNLGKGLKIYRVVIWTPKAGSDNRFVVAVTQDNNDERPKLRVFENTVRGFLERLVVHAGDGFKDLYLEDINRDRVSDAVSLWDCGQSQCISIIGYDEKTNLPKELFHASGRKIEIKSETNAPTEIVTTRRTYQEKPGEPWIMGISVFRWNGKEFAEMIGKDSK